MKQNILLLLAILLLTSVVTAQTSQGIYYQAVVRDNNANLLQSSPASMRFTIHDGAPNGPAVYRQTDTVITDQLGLITVILGGGGSIVTGDFNHINWGLGNKYLQTEIDPTGGTTYTDMGTTQMLSVPYALYAATAGSAPNSDTTWAKTGNDIHNTNTGNVGIHNPNPAAALDVNGWSILGENSPKIKMTKITGVTPSLLGGSTSINTGIPDSKILSVAVQVLDPVNGLIAPLTILTGRQYNYSVISSVFKLELSLVNSLNILGQPYQALIIYEQ